MDANELDRTAALRLMIALTRALKSLGQPLRAHLEEWELSTTEFAVLEVLLHKGPLPLGEIADRILLTGASTTYTVKRLESRGLIRRRPSSEDQRVVFGELTPRGRTLIEAVFPAHAERMRHAMRGLTRQEKRTATELLARMGRVAAEEST